MDKLEELSNDIYLHMLSNGFVWSFEDGRRTPEPSEIADGIESLISRLATEPDGTGIQGGRIYINKYEGEYDVFIHYGTIRPNG